MKNRLVLLSALTCLAGGSVLLAPASGEARYPGCGIPPKSRCVENNVEYCALGSEVYQWVCRSNTWVLEPRGW